MKILALCLFTVTASVPPVPTVSCTGFGSSTSTSTVPAGCDTFMVIMPSLSTGLKAHIPQNPDDKSAPPLDNIVISVLGDRTVRINEERVALGDLEERLKAIFKNAANHVIFIRGDKTLDFNQIAEVIDIAKGAGLDRVALMTQ